MQKLAKLLVLFMIIAFPIKSFSQKAYRINTLEKGQFIKINQGLRSVNGKFNLILQHDGNLCLYSDGDSFIWCTMTNGTSPGYFEMQNDGNLCLYDGNNKPIWCTDTYRGGMDKIGYKLVLYDNGELVLLNWRNRPIWNNKRGRLY